MADIAPPTPTVGQPNSTEEPKIVTAINQLVGAVNDVEATQLASALAQVLGVSQAGTARRGKAIIPGAETRANAAYGTLATPDSVTVVLPTDGLIFVGYSSLWKMSVAGTAFATIFVGANQLKTPGSNSVPLVIETSMSGNFYGPLGTSSSGLSRSDSTTSDSSFVSTGLSGWFGGASSSVVPIWAAAGTYAVSIQFKTTSGTVQVKERKLWVWTMDF